MSNLSLRDEYSRKCEICGVWPVARNLWRQGVPLPFALWLLRPHMQDMVWSRYIALAKPPAPRVVELGGHGRFVGFK